MEIANASIIQPQLLSLRGLTVGNKSRPKKRLSAGDDTWEFPYRTPSVLSFCISINLWQMFASHALPWHLKGLQLVVHTEHFNLQLAGDAGLILEYQLLPVLSRFTPMWASCSRSVPGPQVALSEFHLHAKILSAWDTGESPSSECKCIMDGLYLPGQDRPSDILCMGQWVCRLTKLSWGTPKSKATCYSQSSPDTHFNMHLQN